MFKSIDTDGNGQLSAKELQGNRGATGWFTLKVAVPGCAELWLLDGKGERAKIVIKNERNAALASLECMPIQIVEFHGGRLYTGPLDFCAADGECYLPSWVMKQLGIKAG